MWSGLLYKCHQRKKLGADENKRQWPALVSGLQDIKKNLSHFGPSKKNVNV